MNTIFKNRGMLLETIINQTNEFYFKNDICLIHKKNLDQAVISSKSSVDYYGIYKGKFIAFEAKSTELSILPLKNIKNHQIEYLNLIQKNGGIAF
ncbi:Holliday junction resolvase recU [Chlamydia trachomatis]|nr:Holliday junction resolvase recU [Chlamydia trachomatis]